MLDLSQRLRVRQGGAPLPALPVLRVALFALAGVLLHRATTRERGPAAVPPLPPPLEEEKAASEASEACEERCCRFCYAAEEEEALLQPCACTGTSAHVHASCLRAWQRSALASRGTLENSCRVCSTRFRLPLRLHLAAWFAPSSADRLAVYNASYLRLLCNTLLPLGEPRLRHPSDLLLLVLANEGRVLGGRQLRRGAPLMLMLRSAAVASEAAQAGAILLWLAAMGTNAAGEALDAASRAVGLPSPPAKLLHALTAILLLPVRAVLRYGQPVHSAVHFVQRFPAFRL